MQLVQALGLAFGLSELGLALVKRSRRSGARAQDAGTLRLVWGGILVSGVVAYEVARTCPFGRFEHGPLGAGIALGLLALGVWLRWWAILVLGKFFTVDVAIHPEHQLVTRGPYRVLRHPSYTGALLVIAGIGVLFDSVPAWVCLMLPITAILLRRMQVEERALAAHFGESWRVHSARTQRLVPFVW